jgi:DNA-binding IclR family transcriptional regulator
MVAMPRTPAATATAAPMGSAKPGATPTWTFLTNHAHVLILLGRKNDLRMRDIASQVGVTERAVQRIVAELESEGFLSVHKDGRRNHYTIIDRLHLRHPIEAHRTVRDLIQVIG